MRVSRWGPVVPVAAMALRTILRSAPYGRGGLAPGRDRLAVMIMREADDPARRLPSDPAQAPPTSNLSPQPLPQHRVYGPED